MAEQTQTHEEIMEQAEIKLAMFFACTTEKQWWAMMPEHKAYWIDEVRKFLKQFPEILIKDPDQSLPKCPYPSSMYECMLKPDKNGRIWVKVLPKEEK